MPIPKRSGAMKSCLPRILAGVALASMVAPASLAQASVAIENVQSLSFGNFVAGNGGSVTVSTNGNRNAGGVVLIPSSQGTAAQFTVSGDPNATYTIQLPGNDVVSLTESGNGMFVNNFTSTPSGAGGQLGAGGSQALSVGGTLNVGSDQAPGSYSGTFSVTVSYN
jgi:spore coat protein U-like protein